MVKENEQQNKNKVHSLKRRLLYCNAVKVRRLSFAFTLFSLTLLGIAFGVQAGRVELKKKLSILIAPVALSLLSYLGAKFCIDGLKIITALYILPQLAIIFLFIMRMKTIQAGIEKT